MFLSLSPGGALHLACWADDNVEFDEKLFDAEEEDMLNFFVLKSCTKKDH